MTLRSKLVFLIAGCTFAFGPAFAAQFPSDTDSAGAEGRRFETQKEEDERAREMERTLEAEKKDQVSEVPQAMPLQEGVKFRLELVRFSGNERISSDRLEPLAADLIGKTIGLSDLRQLASKIKAYYRGQGFIAAYVYLPPQDVTGGIVEFAVIEGRLGRVSVTGNHWYGSDTLRRALGLKEGGVVYSRDLEAGLARLNKNQDLDARVRLEPGDLPKTTDVELEVKDRLPLHVSADVNNLGTRNTGRTRYGLAVSHNNLTGAMDQLSGRGQVGSGAWAVGTRYERPVGPWGSVAGISYSHSEVDLGREFEALDVQGDADTYGVDLQHPLFRTEASEWSLLLGFDWKSVNNTILDQPAGEDELRILNYGVVTEFTDPAGKTYLSNVFSNGFANFLGSNDTVDPRATRAGTGGQFFVYRGTLARYQRLPEDMSFSFRSNWQLAGDRLPPSEQFRLGGAFSVRGFPEGDYLADNGVELSSELYIPTYFFPADWKLPYSHEPLRKQVQGVLFADFGAGTLKAALPGEKEDRALAGAGGGLRIHLWDRVYGRFQWARTIGAPASDGNESAFYYGIQTEIF